MTDFADTYVLANDSGQEEPSFAHGWSVYDARKGEKMLLLMDLDEVGKISYDDLCVRVIERRRVRLQRKNNAM